MTSSRLFFSGVFLTSGCLMALQILQSRIFSVTTWYHLAFLVISIAMFGLTLAALTIHLSDAHKQRKMHARIMAIAAGDMGFYIIIALIAQLFIPIVYSSPKGSIITLPLISLFTVLPYYKAGLVLTMALTRTPYSVPRTYGIDLVGAAAGCLCALVLMEWMDVPSAVLVLCLMAFTASFCFSRMDGGYVKSNTMKILAGIVVLAIAINSFSSKPLIYPVWIKSEFHSQKSLMYDEWNAISRVTVGNELVDYKPYLWGPSPLLPENLRTSFYFLRIDGDAGTPIYKFDGDPDSLSFLEYDVTTIAYAVPGIERVGIIGVGGGRDVLTAHYFGATDITALDINNLQISLLSELEPFKSYANISDIDGVKLIHSEARSWFASQHENFDLVQMSLIDTWAATGAGAFALSENGLYTTDAWKVFLDDLRDNGILTVSRWYIPEAASETERLLALAVQSLFELGAENPREHIFLARGGRIATLVLGKSPFTTEQREALISHTEQSGFDIMIAPGRESNTAMFNKIVGVDSPAALQVLTAKNVLDISPPSDIRPFFFNQARLNKPLEVIEMITNNTTQAVFGHARATLNLFLILGFALFMVVFTILRPLYGTTLESNKKYIAAGTMWFMLIGLGFMMLEVTLLQRLSIFLGHPVYSLSVVLFSLVLFTGIGSLLSERVSLFETKRRVLWILLTAATSICLPFFIFYVFEYFSESALLVRVLVCVAITAPLGFLLGFGFPTGMTLANAVDAKPSAWFWGINGAASVMGSALAVALNIAMGLNMTFILGGICYMLLLAPSYMLTKFRPI